MKAKHICTMPIFGEVTRKRVGTKYIHTVEELRSYEQSLAEKGISASPRWRHAPAVTNSDAKPE